MPEILGAEMSSGVFRKSHPSLLSQAMLMAMRKVDFLNGLSFDEAESKLPSAMCYMREGN